MLYLLSIAAWDLGPMVLLTVDWWYYYAQKDMNGIFGAHLNPMRCVVGQSVLLMITSWAFLGALLEYADTEDHFEYFWPWIFHGITSTVVLILCVVLNRSGTVPLVFAFFGRCFSNSVNVTKSPMIIRSESVMKSLTLYVHTSFRSREREQIGSPNPSCLNSIFRCSHDRTCDCCADMVHRNGSP